MAAIQGGSGSMARLAALAAALGAAACSHGAPDRAASGAAQYERSAF